jgi:hypothetical protein
MAGRLRTIAGLATAFIIAAASAAHAAVPTTLIASDPFTNPQSQHAAIVEPDTFAFGSTIVAAAQSGRYFNGGSSGIRYATSTDGGTTWAQGTLPGITVHDGTGGVYQRVTDPAVAYDAQDGVWLVSTRPCRAARRTRATATATRPGTTTGQATSC